MRARTICHPARRPEETGPLFLARGRRDFYYQDFFYFLFFLLFQIIYGAFSASQKRDNNGRNNKYDSATDAADGKRHTRASRTYRNRSRPIARCPLSEEQN